MSSNEYYVLLGIVAAAACKYVIAPVCVTVVTILILNRFSEEKGKKKRR